MTRQEIVGDSVFHIQFEVSKGITVQQIRAAGGTGLVGAGGAAWRILETR